MTFEVIYSERKERSKRQSTEFSKLGSRNVTVTKLGNDKSTNSTKEKCESE